MKNFDYLEKLVKTGCTAVPFNTVNSIAAAATTLGYNVNGGAFDIENDVQYLYLSNSDGGAYHPQK